MRRQFLNLVVESLDTGLHSLRRINLSSNLFYPSSTAAEAAMARSEAAIKANAEKQAGYRHGFRFLQTIASSLGPLPDAVINLKPSVWSADHMPFDMISLLSDESTILWSDSAGCTSLYDVDSNSAMPVPNLRAPKGRGTIPITITRAATNGSLATQRESLYVMGRWLHPNFRDYCFEKLSYEGGQDVFSEHDLSQGWCCVPPPPACELPDYIDAYTVVGGSTIYFSSTKPGVGTYAFDTGSWKWRLAGNWNLPFSGKAEYVPELKLWFGLSTCSPFHLCASDLSAVHFERPPTVDHTWVDLDIPKSWSLFHLDIINLGSGRFCVVKIFHNTVPSLKMGFSDDEGSDNDEALDCGDVINSEFAILTGIEIVGCGGEAPPGKLRMLKHMSKCTIRSWLLCGFLVKLRSTGVNIEEHLRRVLNKAQLIQKHNYGMNTILCSYPTCRQQLLICCVRHLQGNGGNIPACRIHCLSSSMLSTGHQIFKLLQQMHRVEASSEDIQSCERYLAYEMELPDILLFR